MRTLTACSGRIDWPRRGVYFFLEDGERRSDTGQGLRIVRVGTHALKETSKTTLWNRLRQHRGSGRSGGGNHRGSILRLLVGTAIANREPHLAVSTWDRGSSADRETRAGEHTLEVRVSAVIRAMPFLWIGIDDAPGSESQRGYIERNTIALLSNYQRPPVDAPSATWLGYHCNRERVRSSGLWNWRHVDEHCDPKFLDELEALIEAGAGL